MLDDNLRQTIIEVQQGHEQQREEIIQRYLPFILKVTSQSCKRFVRLGVDDEVSVALIAFNEALDKYDCNQNASFFAFSEVVIKRRIIDYFRKKKREAREIPWSVMEDENNSQDSSHQLDKITSDKAFERAYEEETNEMRRQEILEYQRQLQQYGITIQDLVAASPKHQDARQAAFQVARLIYRNKAFQDYLKRTKSLPLKDLEPEVKVSRKTLERQRKYIIALTVILTGEFYYLQEYLRGLGGN